MSPRAAYLASVLWDALVALAATAAVVVVPITILPGFDYRLRGTSPIEWGLTAVFAVDAVVQVRRLRFVRPRRRGWARVGVVMDAVAALPTAAMGLPLGFEVLRLFKLHRVAGLMRGYSRRHSTQASHLRLVFFGYWVGVVVHVIACGFVQLGGVPTSPTDGARYLNALYWTVQTLTTVGYGDVDIGTPVLHAYAILTMLMGVGAYAFLIGNIASLLTAQDPLRAAHEEQRERVAAFLRYRGLPPELQRRVRAYLDHAWDEGFAASEEVALAGLPPGLHEAIALHLRRDLVRGIPLFAGVPEAFVREVALQMRSFVCLPGDTVVTAGDRGHELFVIARGTMEVVSADGFRLRTLEAGDFFGEIALFQDAHRTATVRAMAPSDLYVLDRALFERVVAAYPDVAATLRAAAAQRSEPTPHAL